MQDARPAGTMRASPPPPITQRGIRRMQSTQARQQLETLLRNLQPGDQLPFTRDLARTWAVSYSTASRLLSEYARAGKLLRIRGKGTFVPGGNERVREMPRRRSSVQAVMDAVIQSIARGELKIGDPLPSTKQICLQFHVAPVTVARAYARLCTLGRITRIGRRYWVGDLGSSIRQQARGELWFFTSSGAHPADLLFSSHGLAPLVQGERPGGTGFRVHRRAPGRCGADQPRSLRRGTGHRHYRVPARAQPHR